MQIFQREEDVLGGGGIHALGHFCEMDVLRAHRFQNRRSELELFMQVRHGITHRIFADNADIAPLRMAADDYVTHAQRLDGELNAAAGELRRLSRSRAQ